MWRAGLFGTTILLALLAVFGWTQRPATAAVCGGIADQLTGVWDSAVKAKIRAAFSTIGRPHAGDSYHRVSTALDQYTGAWVAMKTEACEATQVHKTQSEETLTLRMYCLDRRRGWQAPIAFTELFERPADVLRLSAASGWATRRVLDRLLFL